MRPDRIIVGEVRGAEALDMLQAMNTGHDGSLSTCHANAPRDAISRIESMVLMAGIDFPMRAVREQVSRALDLIVQIERFSDGGRRITSITEVQGMEADTVTLQEIFEYKIDTDHVDRAGTLQYSGLRPQCAKFERNGVSLPPFMEQHSFGAPENDAANAFLTGQRVAASFGARPARVDRRYSR
jgi:pilus assembly protein CpaF